MHSFEDVEPAGAALLGAGSVPGPPRGPYSRARHYPLAVDVNGSLGAVTFAVLDAYPHLAAGWWCFAYEYQLVDGDWRYCAEHDNTTTQTPFERPAVATNSTEAWIDWGSYSYSYAWPGEDDTQFVSSLFGVAPAATARLTVTDASGAERPLRITPWNGAFVMRVDGLGCTLTGFDERGEVIGSMTMPSEPADPNR